MARKGFTIKPCPGCGSTMERRAEEVCVDCLGLMEIGRYHKKLYKDLRVLDDVIELKIPEGWDAPRYYPYRAGISRDDKHKEIGVILAEIARKVSMKKGVRVQWGYAQHLCNKLYFDSINEDALPVIYKTRDKLPKKSYNQQYDAIIQRDLFELLEKLHYLIIGYVAEVEKQSVAFGKNVLLMLNAGEITMDEFLKK